MELMEIPLKSDFRFGVHKHKSLGLIENRIPVSNSHYIPREVDVIDIDVPFLLGLDVLMKYGMVIDTDKLRIRSNLEGWDIPLVRKRGHLFLEWEACFLFSSSDVLRVHRHFFHPKSTRLYDVIRRAEPENTSPSLLKGLEKIDSTCDVCQR